MSVKKRIYNAIVWEGDLPGQRLTIEAASYEEVEQYLRKRFGSEIVHSITNDEDANKERLGFKIVRIDLKEIKTKRELLEKLANEFLFPDYFGFNWDAFDECLAEFCSYDVALLLTNRENAGLEIEEEIVILKKCIEDFNSTSGFKVEILE